MLLYVSRLFTSLRASFKSAFGKSVFLVTPKDHERLSWRDAVRVNKGEILFGFTVLAIAVAFNHSPLPTILIAIPGVFSIYLAMMANEE
jgi:hypothetical protein